MIDFLTGIFAIIPQFLYFLYACLASLLDAMQFLVRKLVGLDTYYINGQETSGDIVYDFIKGILGFESKNVDYSSLSTVFWSMVVFGVILLVLSTFFAILKAQYNYDSKKSQPIKILGSSLKSFCLFAIIPLTCVFGMYLSNIILQTLDDITGNPNNNISTTYQSAFANSEANFSQIFKSDDSGSVYASYDFFGVQRYTKTTTFSSVMFEVSAKNANRVRHGTYTASSSSTDGYLSSNKSKFLWSDFGVFVSNNSDQSQRQEEVASMIDYAFANCLTLQDQTKNASLLGRESSVLISSFTFLESAVWYYGCIDVQCFSKYNIGLVWYYYNLWEFNFFLGFAGMIACISVFTSIFFGLVVRLIKLLALFIVYPPLIGIAPLNSNKSIDAWKKEFISNVIMGYGAVVGLNIVFLLLGEFRQITYFTQPLLNEIVDMGLIIVLLAVISDIIKMLSEILGGADAASVGKDSKKAVANIALKATDSTMKAANAALKIGALFNPGLKAASKGVEKVEKKRREIENKRKRKEEIEKLRKSRDEQLKDSSVYGEQSQKDTEDFAKLMEEQSENDTYLEESEEKVESFDNERGDTAAQEAVRRYQRNYQSKVDSIYNDFSLTTEEKNQKINVLRKESVNLAIEYYSSNNKNAILANEADKQATISELEANRIEREVEKSEKLRKKKTGILKNVIDLGGQTLKLIGNVTFISSGVNQFKESSAGDAFNSMAQTFFQEYGFLRQSDKIKDGTSKFLTKKQKAILESTEQSKYEGYIERASNNSQAMLNEILNLEREMKIQKGFKSYVSNIRDSEQILNDMNISDRNIYKVIEQIGAEDLFIETIDKEIEKAEKMREPILQSELERQKNDVVIKAYNQCKNSIYRTENDIFNSIFKFEKIKELDYNEMSRLFDLFKQNIDRLAVNKSDKYKDLVKDQYNNLLSINQSKYIKMGKAVTKQKEKQKKFVLDKFNELFVNEKTIKDMNSEELKNKQDEFNDFVKNLINNVNTDYEKQTIKKYASQMFLKTFKKK